MNGESEQQRRAFNTGASSRNAEALETLSLTCPPEALPFHPAFNGAVRFTSVPRPAGATDEQATAQTVAAMYEYSTADALDPIVRAAAKEATAGRHSQADQLAGIFEWVRSHVSYTDDSDLAYFRPAPADAEVLIRPADLVRMDTPRGDCDDYAMLARAMMLAAGVCDAAIATVEADAEAPGAYSHVYLIAQTTPRATPFDAIPAAAVHGLGYEVTPTGKRRIWNTPTMHKALTTTRPAPPAYGRPTAPPAYGRLNRNAVLSPQVLAPNRSRSALTPSRIAGFLAGLGEFDWNGWSQELTHDAANILGTRYGVPQLDPGMQYRRDADGGFYVERVPAGSSLSLTSGSGAGLSTGMLLIAALGIGAALIFAGKR